MEEPMTMRMYQANWPSSQYLTRILAVAASETETSQTEPGLLKRSKE